MSCGCSTPCNCLPSPSTCCTPTTETVEYTFENANLAGVGVFDNEANYLVQFRGVRSLSAALTVTLNATDNTIDIDFDDAQLVADIPTATTTVRGIAETATNAEALAKAATDKIITPSNFAAMASTTTFAGLVELATDAETITGTSTTLAVTPAGLAAVGATNTLTTWADAVTRAGDTPTFDGRIGVQLDTNIPWVANGTGVGDFDIPLLVGSGTNTLAANANMTLGGFTFLFLGTGAVGVSTTGGFEVTTTALFTGTTQIGAGTGEILNLEGSVVQIDGVTIPADSVLLTSAVDGRLTSLGITEFLSAENTAVWVGPTGTVARTTFITYAGQTISNPPTQAEVQAIDDALVEASQRLGALIDDLMASLKPHAV